MAKQTWVWVLTAAAGLMLLVTVAGTVGAEDVSRMTKERLKSELTKPNLVVIDVRAAGDWKSSQWMIKGAVREDPRDVETWAADYSKDKTYVLYCA